MDGSDHDRGDLGFSAFVADAEPRVRRTLVGLAGPEVASDATADAFEYAWRHWARVGSMANPAGYVYRVARSRIPRRRRRFVPADVAGLDRLPEVEPALAGLLAALPERQRVCVFLVHGCQWHYSEVGELLGLSVSSVRTHCDRALAALRRGLKVDHERLS
jgi:DNA-directed RNA polymerase specialized sigma24 family protein